MIGPDVVDPSLPELASWLPDPVDSLPVDCVDACDAVEPGPDSLDAAPSPSSRVRSFAPVKRWQPEPIANHPTKPTIKAQRETVDVMRI